jgi:proteasome lid subunit RPN8/RPN11
MAVLIPAPMREAMIRHADWCFPEEACGLLAGIPGGPIHMVYPLTNAQRSPVAYTIDPTEHFRALQHAERQGWELVGSFHSHPTSEAYPSATDVAQAPEPNWLHIITGPATHPRMRGFRVVARVITEVRLT